jgi:uncharacterized membrane protein YfcA
VISSNFTNNLLDNIVLISVVLLLVASLYSSVGHGGASGYLAVFSLIGIQATMLKPLALIMNLVVAGISFCLFFRNGFFRFKLLVPFIISSVPFAFLGGYLGLDEWFYKIILGCFLLLSAIKFLFFSSSKQASVSDKKFNLSLALFIGAIIGFFSGLIGIGGGIILSPIILWLGWADTKQTAALSAAFIWINSLFGLTGFFLGEAEILVVDLIEFIPFLIAIILGGFIGSYFGSAKFSKRMVFNLLSVVLLVAGLKMLFF